MYNPEVIQQIAVLYLIYHCAYFYDFANILFKFQAVLCPLPINTLMIRGGTDLEIKYAEDILRLTIQAILITTPIVFVLAKHLGPILLKDKEKECAGEPTTTNLDL